MRFGFPLLCIKLPQQNISQFVSMDCGLISIVFRCYTRANTMDVKQSYFAFISSFRDCRIGYNSIPGGAFARGVVVFHSTVISSSIINHHHPRFGCDGAQERKISPLNLLSDPIQAAGFSI